MLTTLLLAFVLGQTQAQSELKLQAPASVDVCATVWTPVIPLQVERPEKLEGPLRWSVVSAPPGVRAAIVAGERDTASLYMRGFCNGPEGDSQLVVSASIGDLKGQATITLKRGQARVLLVDDDAGPNNAASPSKDLSPSDALYRKLLLDGDGLRSLAYDTVTVQKYANGPALDVLQKYDAIVWYTAAEYGGNRDNTAILSNVDLDNLGAFLSTGKSVILFSPGLVNNYQGYVKVARGNEEQWNKIAHAFLSGPMGLKGARGLIHRFNEVDVESTDGVKFHLAKGKPVEAQISPVNPDKATPLFMANLNPDNTGPRLVPCASANVSGKGTVVYVGFSFENIAEKVGDAFRIVMTPAVGWGAQTPAGAVVFGPVNAPAAQTLPQQRTAAKTAVGEQPSKVDTGLPGAPAAALPSKPATTQPKSPAVAQPSRSSSRQSTKVTIDAPPEKDVARFNRLAEIALALHDPKSDPEALVTEAARLCGFSIWKEDRTKIAGPTGEPALHLAVTDFEIKSYAGMFRRGHWVDLRDVVAAMDIPYKELGGKGSCGQFIDEFLEFGPVANNMSVRALTTFLRDLGASHLNVAKGQSAEYPWLDPVQALFLLRVVTEEMVAPVKKHLARREPGQAMTPPNTAGGLRLASFSPGGDFGEEGLLSFADEAYFTVMPGITGIGLEHLVHEKQIGKYKVQGLVILNMLLVAIKFVATYDLLKAKFSVDGQPAELFNSPANRRKVYGPRSIYKSPNPLKRTKNTSPGEGQHKITAETYIDGNALIEALEHERRNFATLGIELDPPKAGPLKHVETDWEITPGFGEADSIAIKEVDHSAFTNSSGETWMEVTGLPQPFELDPKKVMPVQRINWISVTPAVKTQEASRNVVDGLYVAIGLKENLVSGAIKALTEFAYRMNWHAAGYLMLPIKDWVQADTIGQLDIEIHGGGNRGGGAEFGRDRSTIMSVDRVLSFKDTSMLVGEFKMPAGIDASMLDKLPPELRKAAAEGLANAQKAAGQIQFSSMDPGQAVMTIRDQLDEFSVGGGECLDVPHLVKRTTLWSYSRQEELQPATVPGLLSTGAASRSGRPSTPVILHTAGQLRFNVTVNIAEKTAKLSVRNIVPVSVTRKSSPKQEGERETGKETMGLFDRLKMGAPFQEAGPVVIIPLKETQIIDSSEMNYNGTVSIPFKFGPAFQFTGNAIVSLSLTRKVKK